MSGRGRANILRSWFSLDPASLCLYVFFLLCSGYFACAETAYTAVSKVRLRTMADKGNKRAQRALWICDRFDKTLTTILVGNNIFHAACASLSALLVLRQFGESFVAVGTVVTTVIVYLFAEMLPKSLARARAEVYRQKLQAAADKQLALRKARLLLLGDKLNALGPRQALSRGYALVLDGKKAVTTVAEARDEMTLVLQDGRIQVKTLDIRKEDPFGEETAQL
jgi:exonuclease VII large subunit